MQIRRRRQATAATLGEGAMPMGGKKKGAPTDTKHAKETRIDEGGGYEL